MVHEINLLKNQKSNCIACEDLNIFQTNLRDPDNYYADSQNLYILPSLVTDENITCSAFGALCLMLSYSSQELWTAGRLSHFGRSEGAEACQSILKILLKANYIKRVEVNKSFGWVYLIEAQVNGVLRHKIGESIDPYLRFDSIQSHSPVELTLKHLIQTNDRCQLEKTLHRRYINQKIQLGRRKGEWFELAPEQVEEILNLEVAP